SQPPHPGAARRRARPALHARVLQPEPGDAAARARHPSVQARRAVGDGRRDHAEPVRGGDRGAAQGGGAMSDAATIIDAATTPRVSKRFRLQWEEAQQSWVLLYPEGMVKLNQSAGEILRRCDGVRSVAEVVADLEQAFATTGLEADVIAFLELARKQQWIDV